MKRILLGAAAMAMAGCGPGGNSAAANETAGNAAAAAAAGSRPSAAEVGAMIDRDGATRTVQSLDQGETETQFTAMLEQIATGDAQWLALAPRLKPGVDAGTSTGLMITIAQALPRNAAGVLGLIKDGWPVDEACGYPMIEPTADESRTYFAAAISAVEAVGDPALADAKTACLTGLRAARR